MNKNQTLNNLRENMIYKSSTNVKEKQYSEYGLTHKRLATDKFAPKVIRSIAFFLIYSITEATRHPMQISLLINHCRRYISSYAGHISLLLSLNSICIYFFFFIFSVFFFVARRKKNENVEQNTQRKGSLPSCQKYEERGNKH